MVGRIARSGGDTPAWRDQGPVVLNTGDHSDGNKTNTSNNALASFSSTVETKSRVYDIAGIDARKWRVSFDGSGDVPSWIDYAIYDRDGTQLKDVSNDNLYGSQTIDFGSAVTPAEIEATASSTNGGQIHLQEIQPVLEKRRYLP